MAHLKKRAKFRLEEVKPRSEETIFVKLIRILEATRDPYIELELKRKAFLVHHRPECSYIQNGAGCTCYGPSAEEIEWAKGNGPEPKPLDYYKIDIGPVENERLTPNQQRILNDLRERLFDNINYAEVNLGPMPQHEYMLPRAFPPERQIRIRVDERGNPIHYYEVENIPYEYTHVAYPQDVEYANRYNEMMERLREYRQDEPRRA